jgi:dihydrofolate reductase
MLKAIVCISKNRVIGKNGKMPWHIPEDLKHFKELTLGHPIVMGSKTYDSIGRLLPGRENIILSRSRIIDGATNLRSIDPILQRSAHEDIYICGGESVYRLFWKHLQVLEVTVLDTVIDGDTFFPEIDLNFWEIVNKNAGYNKYKGSSYTFFTLNKVNAQKHFDKNLFP